MMVQPSANSRRRAHRSFWVLLLIAVIAAGSLTSAVAVDPSPVTGLGVGVSGVVLLSSLVLAARVMLADERARRRATSDAGRFQARPVFQFGNLKRRP